MNVEGIPGMPEHASIEESELLECLRKIGQGLIACGTAVGVVENTLTEIAQVYEVKCEIMALPNVIMIKLGQSSLGRVDFAVQRLTTIQLDKVSEFVELIDHVRKKTIPLTQAARQIDQIMLKKPRFGPALVIFGYFLSCIGLTMLFRPDLRSLLITGAAGILVGLITLVSRWRPRFDLLLPVFAAIVVSTLIFDLTRMGFIFGPANLLITPLDHFSTRGTPDYRHDRTGFDAYPVRFFPVDLWCSRAPAVVHRDCNRIEALGVIQPPGLPLRSSRFSLVGSTVGHLVIWSWHIYPLIGCESRPVLDAVGPVYCHVGPILRRVLHKFLCWCLFGSNADGS